MWCVGSPLLWGSRVRVRRPAIQVYVGIDVHRRRSQIAVMDESGRTAANRNVRNGRETVLGVIGDLPVGTPVVFEATYGWGWLIELFQDYGFEPHLAHPLQCSPLARKPYGSALASPWLRWPARGQLPGGDPPPLCGGCRRQRGGEQQEDREDHGVGGGAGQRVSPVRGPHSPHT